MHEETLLFRLHMRWKFDIPPTHATKFLYSVYMCGETLIFCLHMRRKFYILSTRATKFWYFVYVCRYIKEVRTPVTGS